MTLEQKRAVAIANARLRAESAKQTQPEAAGPGIMSAIADSYLGRRAEEPVGETYTELMRERGGFAPPQSDIARKASNQALATTARYGPGVVPGPVGGLLSGAGEVIASTIEDGRPDWGQAGASTVSGAIPFSGARGVVPAALNTLKTGAGVYAGEKLKEFINGVPNSAGTTAAIAAALTTAFPALGRLAGGVDPKDAARLAEGMDAMATKEAREQIKRARQYELVDATGERRRLKVDPTIPAVRNDEDMLMKIAGGKTALGQQVAKENVPVFQGMAQKDLGLKETGSGITMAQIKDAREAFYEPYSKIRQIQSQARDQLAKLEAEVLGPSNGLSPAMAARRAEIEAGPEFQRMARPLRIQAAADVDLLRKTRGDASKKMQQYLQSDGKDVAALEDYKALREAVEAMETKIDDAARLSDDPGLLERLGKSRAGIARSHNYEDAIGPDGIVNPQALRLMDKAGVPLGGHAKEIAEFAHNARGNAVELSRIGDPNANAAGGLAGAHAMATSPKTGGIAAAIPYLRNKARARLLSEGRQAELLDPKPRTTYDPATVNLLARMMELRASNSNQGRK